MLHRLQLFTLLVEIAVFLYLMHSSLYEDDVPELPHASDIDLSDTLSVHYEILFAYLSKSISYYTPK